MTSVFDSASFLIQPYTAAGYSIASKYSYTAVAPSSTNGGSYDLIGGFALAKRSNDNMLLVVTQLESINAFSPTTNWILQTYLQFRDWDNMSTSTVPSWMNFVCNLTVPATASSSTTA